MARVVAAFFVDWMIGSAVCLVTTLAAVTPALVFLSGWPRLAFAAVVGAGAQIVLISWLAKGRHRPPGVGRRLIQS